MEVLWWSCALVTLSMLTDATPDRWTVSQSPSSTSFKAVNSSAEITCSTSFSSPMGLYLIGLHRGSREIIYLSFKKGQVSKTTTATEFEGRVRASPDRAVRTGQAITLRLSQLGLGDTDLYICTWRRFVLEIGKLETQSSNGTVIIVTEEDPDQRCKPQTLQLVLVCLSTAAFTSVLLLCVGAAVLRCRKFKKNFRPGRDVKLPRANSPPPRPCPQHRKQLSPYMVTAVDSPGFMGVQRSSVSAFF